MSAPRCSHPAESRRSSVGARRPSETCRDCEKVRRARWRKRHPDAHRANGRRYYARHRDRKLAANKARYDANADMRRARQRSYYQGLKDAAYAAYGGYRCRCCGETEPVFLCLDHTNDDGAKHRKSVSAAELYLWLKREGYPPVMQVLCHNCNFAKRTGVCPHVRRPAAGRAA